MKNKERIVGKDPLPRATEQEWLEVMIERWNEVVKSGRYIITQFDWTYEQNKGLLDEETASIISTLFTNLKSKISELGSKDITGLNSKQLEALYDELNPLVGDAEALRLVIWDIHHKYDDLNRIVKELSLKFKVKTGNRE